MLLSAWLIATLSPLERGNWLKSIVIFLTDFNLFFFFYFSLFAFWNLNFNGVWWFSERWVCRSVYKKWKFWCISLLHLYKSLFLTMNENLHWYSSISNPNNLFICIIFENFKICNCHYFGNYEAVLKISQIQFFAT